MAVYHAESLLFGPYNERPELDDPTIYSASGTALFLATDTAELYETSGSAWTLLGLLSLPGTTSDGANGLVVQDALTAGNATSFPKPDFHTLYGITQIVDTRGNWNDSDPALHVSQGAAFGPDDLPVWCVRVIRGGNVDVSDYIHPAVEVFDNTASLQPVFRVIKQGTAVLEIGASKSITGALSAVTDPAAKAVLTSVITMLAGIKVATNDTT